MKKQIVSNDNLYVSSYNVTNLIEKTKNGDIESCSGLTPKTQKAKGVFFLQNKSAALQAAFNWKVPQHIVFESGEEFTDQDFNFPVFARPCPTVPRHGFVDSTFCKDSNVLNFVSKKAKEVEPEAEIMVVKPVDSAFNAIITGGVISFGRENDGATSGKDVQYFYIADDIISPIIQLDKSLLLEGEVPFYEMVISKGGTPYLVQCRSAPGVPPVKDYIPDNFVVKNIIKAGGDLIEWEHKMKESMPSGTVIDHNGGSLASHYSIHAIINNIPILTTRQPLLGETLEKNLNVDNAINEKDKDNFFYGFQQGFSSTKNTVNYSSYNKDITRILRDNVMLSLATLHNFSSISMHKDYKLLGQVLGLFTRTCFAVSKGEVRYASSRISSKDFDAVKDIMKSVPDSRSACYSKSYQLNATDAIQDAVNSFIVFSKPWSGSFGGKRWASCTKSAITLYNYCITKNIKKAVEQFNVVINENHNGGKYLNKIIDVANFDIAAQNVSKFTLQNIAMIFDILDTVKYSEIENSDAKEVDFSNIQGTPVVANKLSTTNSNGEYFIENFKIKEVLLIKDFGKLKYKVIFQNEKSETKEIILPINKKFVGDYAKSIESFLKSEDLEQKLTGIPFYWAMASGPVISKALFKKLFLEELKNEKEVLKNNSKEIFDNISSFEKNVSSKIIDTSVKSEPKFISNESKKLFSGDTSSKKDLEDILKKYKTLIGEPTKTPLKDLETFSKTIMELDNYYYKQGNNYYTPKFKINKKDNE